MDKINVSKLQKFIEENTNKELTPQEITKLIMEIKLGILQQAEQALKQALEEKSPEMVAAISELISSINL